MTDTAKSRSAAKRSAARQSSEQAAPPVASPDPADPPSPGTESLPPPSDTPSANLALPDRPRSPLVFGGRIRQIRIDQSGALPTCVIDDDAISPFTLTREFVAKYRPQPGGFILRYENGTQQYDPPVTDL